MRRMDEVRIVEHPEPGEICLRPGRRPAWDVLQVVVFACAVLPLCAIWARDAFVVFGLGSIGRRVAIALRLRLIRVGHTSSWYLRIPTAAWQHLTRFQLLTS